MVNAKLKLNQNYFGIILKLSKPKDAEAQKQRINYFYLSTFQVRVPFTNGKGEVLFKCDWGKGKEE